MTWYPVRQEHISWDCENSQFNYTTADKANIFHKKVKLETIKSVSVNSESESGKPKEVQL